MKVRMLRITNKYKDMKKEHKQLIVNEIIDLSKNRSQNAIATRLGVSSATISQMVNGNWRLIKNEMWRKVKVKLKLDLNWSVAEISIYKQLTTLATAAQERSLTLSFSHKAGTGKSTLFVSYAKKNKNVIYVEGNRTMSKKTYIKQLLTNAGIDNYGTTELLIQRFIDHVSELETPLIIIDQFDKLKEGAFDLFMDFYNALQGHCGFLISGVQALKKKVMLGVQRLKIGYEEIWSRMGRKFVELHYLSLADVKLICEANSVTNEGYINEVFNGCEGDLRRVRKDIERFHLINI